ncbi:MAG: TolC family protein [Proteobacteria bacterium]|nr:TolC family protein [Pseudomonadota bacterium]MCG2744869.1 TolC family protein [Desulfobacteraceae bacterium]MBU3984283.1 TolC family protein [Pseudomonadota bacterium]MBU4029003.1 TolC family protein [Pseudomonadota bacterium]MBU4043357.1 TolC family protein [Pseudomonadota bacterium]
MKKRVYMFSIMLTTGLAVFSFHQQALQAQTISPVTAEAKMTPSPPRTIKEGETLTLAKVVAITRQNQPAILAAKGNVNASQSRIGQAKSFYYPQINGSTSYDRLSPGGTMYGTSDDSAYNQLAVAMNGSQLLFDFGKTKTQVEIQKTSFEAARSDLNAADDRSVFNAKLAYYDILKIARNKKVAIETVKQFEQHLAQAKGFFEAGVKPKYDVTKAEVDLSHAKLLQIQVENTLRLARVVLNNAMGLPAAPDYQLEDTLTSVKFTLPYEQALGLAMDHRPDLKALVLRKQTAQQSVDLARKGDMPILSGNAGAGYSGDADTMDEGWSAGIAITVPIFNGHLTRHQIGEAQANAVILAANVTALQQSIHKDVQQSYLNLQEAEERIAVTQLTIEQAKENSRIASGRYSAGVGSPIEVTDADILLVQAKADHIQALYDYRIAQTSIEQSIGMTGENSLTTKTE